MQQLLLFFSLFVLSLNAQETILFQENFETQTTTHFVNEFDNNTPTTGTSPCGRASVGNTSHYNSTNVNFNATQNSGYFLGVNPEFPCGGYYTDDLILTNPIDISSATSTVKFKCSYYKTNTLGWGESELKIIIGDGTNSFTIESELNQVNQWTDFEINIPSSFISGQITSMQIKIGGGEGIGLDNISFVYGDPLNTSDFIKNTLSIYPNPTSEMVRWNTNKSINRIEIFSILGKKIKDLEIKSNQNGINIQSLKKGTYFFKFHYNNQIYIKQIVKE